MPRKERKDFPDCCCDIFYAVNLNYLREINDMFKECFMYIYVDRFGGVENVGCINLLVHFGL